MGPSTPRSLLTTQPNAGRRTEPIWPEAAEAQQIGQRQAADTEGADAEELTPRWPAAGFDAFQHCVSLSLRYTSSAVPAETSPVDARCGSGGSGAKGNRRELEHTRRLPRL